MSTEPITPTVTDNPTASRYEITVGQDAVAGFAAYRRSGTRTVFTHTEIDPEIGGKGFGSILARAALDAERAAHRRVVPVCPFIASFIRRHPEYQDLVDAA